MKRIIFSCFALIIIVVASILLIYRKDNNKKDLKKVKVAEVAHSIFYAPWYAANALGYFEDEGLDVEIVLASGADKVTAAVLSGDVQIGFCGSEATIYVYNEGEKDYLVNFAGLTKKDGSFLVSRKKIENFKVEDLKGSYIIGGRQFGMPEMTLEWALKQNGINVKEDVNIDTSIAFAAMGGAFIGGTGDFVSLFEPNALQIEKQGLGYVVASVGQLGGTVPYTAYNTRKSYLQKNPDVIKGFTKAIQKGIDYVYTHTDEEVAKTILNYFPDISLNDLTSIIKRYREIDSWYDTTFINEKDFKHIMEIMQNAGVENAFAPYQDLVDNTYAKENLRN